MFTQTVTMERPAQAQHAGVLRLRGHAAPKPENLLQKIAAFVGQLELSPHTAEQQRRLSEWKARYLSDFASLDDEESRFLAFTDLIFLHSDVIAPAIRAVDDDELSACEKRLKALAAELMPGIDIESCLGADRNSIRFCDKTAAIDAEYLAIEQKVVDAGNALLQTDRETHKAVNEKLCGYADRYRQQHAALCLDLEPLSDGLMRDTEKMIALDEKAIDIGALLKGQRATLDGLLDSCQQLASRKVRR